MHLEQLALRHAFGRVAAGAAAVASAAFLAVASATPASATLGSGPAAPAPPVSSQGSGGSAAVITPLLKILDFGDTFGLPEICNTGASVISAGAAEFNVSNQVVPMVSAITASCTKLSESGHASLQQAIAASQSMTMLNAYFNPAIAAFAGGLQSVADNYGAALAPAGPTIASFATDVTFFEGS
jgi:hypothetical protein